MDKLVWSEQVTSGHNSTYILHKCHLMNHNTFSPCYKLRPFQTNTCLQLSQPFKQNHMWQQLLIWKLSCGKLSGNGNVCQLQPCNDRFHVTGFLWTKLFRVDLTVHCEDTGLYMQPTWFKKKKKENGKKIISEVHVSLPTTGSLEATYTVTHQILSLYTSNQLLKVKYIKYIFYK